MHHTRDQKHNTNVFPSFFFLFIKNKQKLKPIVVFGELNIKKKKEEEEALHVIQSVFLFLAPHLHNGLLHAAHKSQHVSRPPFTSHRHTEKETRKPPIPQHTHIHTHTHKKKSSILHKRKTTTRKEPQQEQQQQQQRRRK